MTRTDNEVPGGSQTPPIFQVINDNLETFYRSAVRLVGCNHADDLLQEALVICVTNAAAGKYANCDLEHIKASIHRTIIYSGYNFNRSKARKRARNVDLHDHHLAIVPTGPDASTREEVQLVINLAISMCPERAQPFLRELLSSDEDNMSIVEVATKSKYCPSIRTGWRWFFMFKREFAKIWTSRN